MKTSRVIIIILVFGLFFGIIFTSLTSSKNVDDSKIKILDAFNSSSDKLDIMVKLKDNNLSVKVDTNNGRSSKLAGLVYMHLSKEELLDLYSSGLIESAYQSHQIKAFLQQSIPLINVSNVWNLKSGGINLTGGSRKVCIIDTGADFSHPALTGKNASCVVDCYNRACVQNCSISDDNGHGTHVAGIVAASGPISGIGANISLIAVKILNAAGSGSGNDNDLSNAIDYCASQNVSVISMSLGTNTLWNDSCDSDADILAWKTAVDSATSQGISVVAASGNDGSYTNISAPACLNNAIPVGDTYDADVGGVTWPDIPCTDSSTFADKIVCHSNRNSLVKILAPGTSINSTCLLGDTGYLNGYCSKSGTSMATPHVAGAIAIIEQYLSLTGRSKTPSEIEQVLYDSGKIISDTGYSEINYSRINVFEAIVSFDEESPSVELISPENESTSLNINQTFRCNATDLYLKNVTFYLWNSTSIVNSTSENVSGATDSFEVNISDLQKGDYTWNCQYYDENGNLGISNNYTFNIGKKQVILVAMDGVEVAHFNALLAAGNLTNFASLISAGWNGTANITGHTTTQTAPGNAELLTGLNQTLNNVSSNTVTLVPDGKTIYERLKAYNSNIKVGFVYGKTKSYIPNGIFANSLADLDWRYNITNYSNTDWKIAQSAVSASTYVYSENVSDKAAEFISLYKNDSFFLVVYFGVPDGSGHAYRENSTQYELALIDSDNGIGKLMTHLDDAGILSDVQIIVSADHGWDINGTGHTSTPNSQILPLLTNNADLIINNSDGIRKQCDITPTILDYFGVLSTNYSDIIGNGCYSMFGDSSKQGISINTPSGTYSSLPVIFNLTTDKEASACNFSIDDGATNETMTSEDGFIFDASLNNLSNADYTVLFYCWDLFDALSTSSSSFSVNVGSDSGNNHGGGGGGGGSLPASTILANEIDSGITKELTRASKISFELNSGGRKETHSLTFNSLINNSAIITISSNPVTFILSVGEHKKINLTNSEYYDLEVLLEGVNNITNRVSITLKSIHEKIFPDSLNSVNESIENVSNNNELLQTADPTTNIQDNRNSIIKGIVYLVIILFVILFAIGVVRRIKSK